MSVSSFDSEGFAEARTHRQLLLSEPSALKPTPGAFAWEHYTPQHMDGNPQQSIVTKLETERAGRRSCRLDARPYRYFSDW
jgi:hypothetical protein